MSDTLHTPESPDAAAAPSVAPSVASADLPHPAAKADIHSDINAVTLAAANPDNPSAPAAASAAVPHAAPAAVPSHPAPPRGPHPLLAVLAERHPVLFGAQPQPLKRGIFDDLLAHGEASCQPWDKAELKAALAQHARSTRYLKAMSEGEQRHDLNGAAVEVLAPEHRYHALVEYFRRKQQRTPYDLTPQVKKKIAAAQECSGLSADAYAELVRGKDEAINAVLDEAMREAAARSAKDEALLRAWQASGSPVEQFADDYGLPRQQVQQAIARAQRLAAPASTAPASAHSPADPAVEATAAPADGPPTAAAAEDS